MARESTLSQQILQELEMDGPVSDHSGQATATLRKRVGHKGSEVGFAKSLAALESRGFIAREIRGKRTYRIVLASAAGSSSSSPFEEAPVTSSSPRGEIEYQRLAMDLLRRVSAVIAQGAVREQSGRNKRQNDDAVSSRELTLKRELRELRAQLSMVSEERRELANKLANAERNIEILSKKLESHPKRSSGATIHELKPDEIAVLHSLLQDSLAGG